MKYPKISDLTNKPFKIFIPYNFITLNEYINKERTNKYKASTIKKRETNIACFYFKPYTNTIKQLKTPLKLKFVWYLDNKKKDLDNIVFSKKFIIDGLVKIECLKNDGQKYINSFEDSIVYCDINKTGVEIEFIEKI